MTRYVLEDDPSYLGTAKVYGEHTASTNQAIADAVPVEPGGHVLALEHELGVLLVDADRGVDEALVLGRYRARETHDVARFSIGVGALRYLEAEHGDDVRFYDRDGGVLLVRGFL